MILKNYVLVVIATVLLTTPIWTQQGRLDDADEEFKAYAFVDARKIYKDVAKKGYASSDLFKKLGDSYYFNGELEEANEWYEKLIGSYAANIDPEYLFRYSQTLKSQERYNEADKVMLLFNEATGSDQRAEDFVTTRDYLRFIELQSGKYRLLKLGINTKFSDYAPSFDQQGNVVFASSRLGSGMTKTVHEWNEMPFLNLFSSSMLPENGILQTPKKLKGKINTRFHESSTVFTKDGKTVYFTRNNFTEKKLKSNEAGTVLLKLYKATLDGEKWTDIKELPFNSDEYSVAHPALSPDGKRLYFASDMPGSFGLSDLFVVDILGEDQYGTPINLGNKINTEGRETFPFISKSGRLYFASDGQVGLGGLDVFAALPEFLTFSRPYNVGKPINSSEDDFTFVIDEDSRIGYFSSNRNGGKGNDDIYSFKQTGDLILNCNQYLNGVVTDASTREILIGADVVLMDENNQEVSRTITDANGNYQLPIACESSYIIRATKESYTPTEAILKTNTALEFTHQLPLQLGQNGLVNQTIKPGDDLAKVLRLQIIYFDLDKSFIRPDAEEELQKIIAVMKEYPDLKIDVRSHTDSRAGDNYNMLLSERRARSTMKYLIKEGGIDTSRLSGRGYGESSLTNECSNGKNCTEEQHQLNRRSEFIVLE